MSTCMTTHKLCISKEQSRLSTNKFEAPWSSQNSHMRSLQQLELHLLTKHNKLLKLWTNLELVIIET